MLSVRRAGRVITPLRARVGVPRALPLVLAIVGAVLLASACRHGGSTTDDLNPLAEVKPQPTPIGAELSIASSHGGTPATGPGSRYNHCERIWCSIHKENYGMEHFVRAHNGWILHDESMGDVYVPLERESGPAFPHARLSVLRLCGTHIHPFLLGRGGGAVHDGMYTYGLDYNRKHFKVFGTRLEPCCVNGLGWEYVHSGGRFFRFHDLEEYRGHPERGWQAPISAELVAGAQPE
jgi:hypothetical protein